MNILQIRSEFKDNGPGTQTLTLSKQLRERGHKVELMSSGGVLEQIIRRNGFKFYQIKELAFENRSILNVISAVRKVKQIIKKNNIEIIHAHNAASLYISYFAVKSLSINVKLFHSCRGIELRKFYIWRNYIYWNYPAKVFAVCDWTKRKLMKFGLKENQIIITYNGVDTKRFDNKNREKYRKEIRSELKIPDDAIVVGIIGRVNVKGHDELIKAHSVLQKKCNNLVTVLVGDGPSLKDFKVLAKKLNVNQNLIFTGYRLDSEKVSAAFDIYAQPSYWGEMFPNAILENMAYGNPIISTNLSGIPEMIGTGEGVIISPKDTNSLIQNILDLYQNKELRRRMGAKGINAIRSRFNIKSVVDTIETEYLKE